MSTDTTFNATEELTRRFARVERKLRETLEASRNSAQKDMKELVEALDLSLSDEGTRAFEQAADWRIDDMIKRAAFIKVYGDAIHALHTMTEKGTQGMFAQFTFEQFGASAYHSGFSSSPTTNQLRAHTSAAWSQIVQDISFLLGPSVNTITPEQLERENKELNEKRELQTALAIKTNRINELRKKKGKLSFAKANLIAVELSKLTGDDAYIVQTAEDGNKYFIMEHAGKTTNLKKVCKFNSGVQVTL